MLQSNNTAEERRSPSADPLGTSDGDAPQGPRALFCALYADAEANVHQLEPALRVVSSIFAGTVPVEPAEAPPAVYVEGLLHWARQTITPVPRELAAPSWPARVVRELGPAGLCDGAWLHGAVRSSALPSASRRCLLEQLALHVGGRGQEESYVQRYAELLASVGVPPGSLTRWDFTEMAACTDVSYERALIGLTLGQFPETYGLEALGFNLWMSTLGPAPILDQLVEPLNERMACLRYLDRYDRLPLGRLAVESVLLALQHDPDPASRRRITHGFCVAHAAYRRWEQAMSGPNVPYTPWDSVLEMVRRKARFAADHHHDVRLGGKDLYALLAEGGSAHEWLVEHLAASPLIRPGAPDESRFMKHTLSLNGPMFDAFTAAEKEDLRAWIATLGTRDEARTMTPPIELTGEYSAPSEPEAFARSADARFGALSPIELHQQIRDVESHPGVRLAARRHVEGLLADVHRAFDEDERLQGKDVPPYSEHAAVALLASHRAEGDATTAARASARESARPLRLALADWLGPLGDARDMQFDEFRYLFEIQAACARLGCEPQASASAEAPASSAEARLSAAVGLNARLFLPELLGLTLAQVGAQSRDAAARAAIGGPPSGALAPRAAAEHGDLALAAVLAFMRRVKDGAPSAVEPNWKRLWRAWHCVQLLVCAGPPERREALLEHFRDRL